MNTFSHILMGKILYEYIKEKHGIHLDKKGFVKGNYSPDFSTSMIKRPHYIKNNLSFVQNQIDTLANTNLNSFYVDKDYSKRLGIICHYCSDFFCYAHSIHFKSNMKAHIKYESQLHKYLVSRLSTIKNIRFMIKKDCYSNSNKISKMIDDYQSDYLNSKHNCSKDLIYSFQVCVELIVSLITCSYNLNNKPTEILSYKESSVG